MRTRENDKNQMYGLNLLQPPIRSRAPVPSLMPPVPLSKNITIYSRINCYKSDHRCHRTIAIHDVQKSKLISSNVTENKENFFTIYLFIEVNLFSYLDHDQLTTLFLTGKHSLLQLSLSYI